MSDSKISALTGATTPLAGTEVLPVVQVGATVQVSVANLTTGRSVSASRYTVTSGVGTPSSNAQFGWVASQGAVITGIGTTYDVLLTNKTNQSVLGINTGSRDAILTAGNLVQGTAGKGINFTANTPAAGMTSQLLDDYEEGDFTPTIEGTTAAGVGTYSVRAGRYTKIGRLVTYTIQIAWSAHTGTGNMILTGLPFTSTGVNAAQFIVPLSLTVTAGSQPSAIIPSGGTTMSLYNQVAGSVSLLPLDTAATLNIAGHYIVT